MNTSSNIDNFTMYEYDAETGTCVLNNDIEDQKTKAIYDRIASEHDPKDFPDQ